MFLGSIMGEICTSAVKLEDGPNGGGGLGDAGGCPMHRGRIFGFA